MINFFRKLMGLIMLIASPIYFAFGIMYYVENYVNDVGGMVISTYGAIIIIVLFVFLVCRYLLDDCNDI